MKLYYRLIPWFILALILLSACDVLVNGHTEPLIIPTETATLSIQMWGEALPTDMPTQESDVIETPIPTRKLPKSTDEVETISSAVSVTATPTVTHQLQPPVDPDSAVTTLLFTGSIVPGRCVQKALDDRGNPRYIYEDIQDILLEADITVGTLNAALSDFPPHTGWCEDSSFVLMGRANNADVMADVGFDIMNIATNHIKNCGVPDCGDRTFLDTLENLERVGISAVGGGRNLADALQPLVVTVNGIRFGFVALGADYGANNFATASKPGIAALTEENLNSAIRIATEISDVVIVMLHWGSDYSTTPNSYQTHFGNIAARAKANLVVGNHSHVFQGMETIRDTPVFYSLGSFVFDQDWSLETQQGLVIRVTFQGTEFAWYDVIPVHIDGNGHVQVASDKEAADILERFQELNAALE